MPDSLTFVSVLAVVFFAVAVAAFYFAFFLLAKYRQALAVDREQAEKIKDLALGMDNAFDTIFITDETGEFVYVNKAFKKNTGFAGSEVVGQKSESVNLWGGMDPVIFYEKLADEAVENGPVFSGIFKNKKKNGDEYIAETKIVKISGSRPLLFVAVERDITESYELDKAKASFVSLAAHQLRTPLSIIRWHTDLLRGGSYGEISNKQRNVIEKIEATNNRLADTISLMLNISRLEMRNVRVKSELIDIESFVREVVGAYKNSANERGIMLKVQVNQSLEKLATDKGLLRLIMENLLENAIKYTPSKGLVSVGVVRDDENKCVTLQVKDTGCGIPDVEKDKIFSKGFRASNAMAVSVNGTGLGLYLVKHILELLGGEIDFYSAVGQGTVIEVRLPCVIENNERAQISADLHEH
ncbi:hypothetical protein A2482_03440 [Candidatus Falkowbacteria bacterium RIFOXYC2_FULL_48_21]|uniref:histidine kinase n=1 Tax=Candidatus Falkowbacteria bacterium RIFOXYC2_FULL_48_21 TaxID=1798005 RepID=A0A1F5T5Q1_9BACT|nr:MAG: hypothetical protein A2482_03440 [Candidatus Falkowbacteria bacterium RIFOXYC2_FULL_48_21]